MISISPDDRLIAVGGWTVGIYTTEGERPGVIYPIEVGREVFSLSFSPDGNKLACGTETDIRIYDVKIGTLVLAPFKGHTTRISCVLWSLDGSRLFSAVIKRFAVGTLEWEDKPDNRGQVAPTTYTLSLSSDGTLLASVSLDKTVRFWDTAHGRPAGQDLQHYTGVDFVCFSPSAEFMASTNRN